MVDVAEVKIWGELVGAVRWDQYDNNFLSKNIDLSPIKMSVNNGNRIYNFPELRTKYNEENTFKGLPGLLSDALPDKYGNQLINLWLA